MSKQTGKLAQRDSQRSVSIVQDASNSTRIPSSSSTTKSAFEDFITAMRALSSDSGLDRVRINFENIPALEATIKLRDQEIVELKAQLRQQTSTHDVTHQKSLHIYNTDRDQLNAQLEEAQNSAASLKKELGNSHAEIGALKDNEASLTKQIDQLNEYVKRSEEAAKKADAKSKETIQKQRAQLSEFDSSKKQHQSTAKQLEDIRSLAITLSDEGLQPLMKELDNLWSTTSALVCSIFYQDLSNEILQHDASWNRLRQSQHRDVILPLSQCNTEAAKQMRCTMIMAMMARNIEAHIFQATYFLPSGSGMRELLFHQAQENSKKESTIRSFIQAMFPKEQDHVAGTRVLQTCDEIMKEDFAGIIPINTETRLKDGVLDLLKSACDIWQKVQRSRYAMDFSFEVAQVYERDCRQLQFDVSSATFTPEAVDINHGDDPMIVVFPRLYVSDEHGQYYTTAQVSLLRSQTQAARRELDQKPSSPRMGRNNSMFPPLRRPQGGLPGRPPGNNELESKARDARPLN